MSYAMKSAFYKLAMKEKNQIKPLKPLFNQYYSIFCPKIAIIITPMFPMIFPYFGPYQNPGTRKVARRIGSIFGAHICFTFPCLCSCKMFKCASIWAQRGSNRGQKFRRFLGFFLFFNGILMPIWGFNYSKMAN